MDGQEMLAYEIGKMREAKFLRDAAQRHMAQSFGNSEPIGSRLRLIVPMVLGLAAALVALVTR